MEAIYRKQHTSQERWDPRNLRERAPAEPKMDGELGTTLVIALLATLLRTRRFQESCAPHHPGFSKR